MGGQQFCSGGVLLDTRGLSRVLALDGHRRTIEVEAGIEWSALLRHLYRTQEARPGAWAIAQKPSGVDRATVGGGVSANVHGQTRCARSLPMSSLVCRAGRTTRTL
jgi:FAD/FMN-containing dehydrogenase